MVLEAELVARCQAGDHAAFSELFARYKDRAFRLAYAILGDPALADDATQEAFIQAFRALRNVRPGAPFGPWFLAILGKRARRLAVRRHRWRWLPLVSAGGVPDQRAASALDAVEGLQVWAAVRQLPVDLRVVVGLRYVLDMGEAEMAAVLGLPAGTVKSRLHRARKRLQEALRMDWEEVTQQWISLTR